MERAGTTVRGGCRPTDMVRVAGAPGPFASVWLAGSGLGAYDNSARAREQQVRRQLSNGGAPDPVAAIAAELAVGGTSPGVAVITDGSDEPLIEHLDAPPRRELVRWSPVPAWSAAIEHRQALIPAIVVLADRLGADVLVSSAGGSAVIEVAGADDPVRKSAPGGWSQRRYQQRAENTWEHNAELVAGEVAREAEAIRPDLVVLGGEGRVVQAIAERLPGELRAVTHTMASGRAIDGSVDQRADDVSRLVRTAIAEQTVDALQVLGQEDGRGGLAANGAVATFEALGQEQVDVLLVHDDPDDDRWAWWSAARGTAALDRDTLIALGVDDAVEDRLIDVAVAAALRSGASVRVVPDAAVLVGGIAAVLRWS